MDFRGKYGKCCEDGFYKIYKYFGIRQKPEISDRAFEERKAYFAKIRDDQTDCLFYIDKRRDGSTLKRLVITESEKLRVFEECHSADFSGHAGRDNTIRKIKQRYYWPDYYKDTVEMVRRFDVQRHACFLFTSAFSCRHIFNSSHYTCKLKKTAP